MTTVTPWTRTDLLASEPDVVRDAVLTALVAGRPVTVVTEHHRSMRVEPIAGHVQAVETRSVSIATADAPATTRTPPALPAVATRPVPAGHDHDGSPWVTVGLAAGGLTVAGIAVLTIALFALWVTSEIAAMSAWVSAHASLIIGIPLVLMFLAVAAITRATHCPGTHCESCKR